jgi:undecaprenyl-diphosphatase
MEKLFNKKTAFWFCSLAVLFKSFLSAALELHPDEAYYWLWSKHLALGYYDHSPMVAYFIKLTTLFSDAEFFVRFSSVAVTAAVSVLVWKFAKELFNETAAAASVIIINSLPLMLAGSLIITPDTPVFLFWSFAVYFLWRASVSRCGETKYFYLTGLFFGLALLSKYTAVLFAPCVLCYMVFDKKLFWLKNKHFYFAFVLSFAVFLPVLVWNAQNGWISFSYQLGHGLSSREIHFNYVFEYLGAQALVAGPFVFFAGFAAVISKIKRKAFDSKTVFLSSFSIPVILFFAATALKRYPGANWPSFAYFSFSVLTAAYLLSNVTPLKKKILIAAVVFNAVLSAAAGLHAKFTIFPVQKFSQKAAIADATNWFCGWRYLGNDILSSQAKYAVTGKHQWSAALEYYTGGKVKAFVDSPKRSQYYYWETPDDMPDSKTVFVNVDNEMTSDYSKIPGARVFYVYRYGVPVRQYAASEMSGYDFKNHSFKNKK